MGAADDLAGKGAGLRWARATLVFVVLIGAWPWIKGPFGAVYRPLMRVTWSTLATGGIRFEEAKGPRRFMHDTRVYSERDGVHDWGFYFNSREEAFIPLAVVVALVLGFRRRAQWKRALLWGGGATCLYIVMRCGVLLLWQFWEHLPRCQIEGAHGIKGDSSALGAVLGAAGRLCNSPTLNVAFPVAAFLLTYWCTRVPATPSDA